MRVFFSTTPEHLSDYLKVAREVVLGYGWDLSTRSATDWLIEAGVQAVDESDLVLALVGWGRGPIPPLEAGGDGMRSWAQWELERAFLLKKPVLVFMATDSWPQELREMGTVGRSVLADFRGELGRLAIPFSVTEAGASDADLAAFADIVRTELSRYRTSTVDLRKRSSGVEPGRSEPILAQESLSLERFDPPELPGEPYPLLLPYRHPELMAGRDRELDDVIRHLRGPVPIHGLYASSGAGKSSLLAGGVTPLLRAGGRGVAIVRTPASSGIVARLLDQLVARSDGHGLELEDSDHSGFVETLLVAHRLSGGIAPVLILDQFEDLFRPSESTRRPRALIGALLAATLQRRPGIDGPLAYWLLAYRQEYHGEIFLWLSDVLREARIEGVPGIEGLPHDLAEPDRFRSFPLSPFGTPAPGSSDRLDEACRAFEEAIEGPLSLIDDQGKSLYGIRFVAGGAKRLARAFAEARLVHTEAPLVPELQVVLAHLLEQSGPVQKEWIEIEVPEDPHELIDDALERHVGRSLQAVFPTDSAADRAGRSRALLALRQLAEVSGRSEAGHRSEELERAIGKHGRAILERLATPWARLVVLEKHGQEWIYALSHDRLAEVVVKLVDEEGRGIGLSIDSQLIALHRLISLKTELWLSGEIDPATSVPLESLRLIEAHADALLWDEEQCRWFKAVKDRRRRQRRRRTGILGLSTIALVLTVLAIWSWVDGRTRRREQLDQIVTGQAQAAVAAVVALRGEEAGLSAEILDRLGQREHRFDLLERGLGGVSESERGQTAVMLAELSLPLLAEAPEDPVAIASILWAIDIFALRSEDSKLKGRALELREQILGPLRARIPPPPMPGIDAQGWSDIPSGSFLMGTGPEEVHHRVTTREQYEIEVAGFRIAIHETTCAEYRRLVPDRECEDDLPVRRLSWYDAYAYAAWLGGRLATGAEWEYAARAGCPYPYCDRNGERATLSEVAWWSANATDPTTLKASARPVGLLEPNAWGLYDMLGNSQEWVAVAENPNPEEQRIDPVGRRDYRGGNIGLPARFLVAGISSPGRPLAKVAGIRVVLPKLDAE